MENSTLKQEYFKKYREDHAEKLKDTVKKWFKANPTKRKEYQDRYWSKKELENKKALGEKDLAAVDKL